MMKKVFLMLVTCCMLSGILSFQAKAQDGMFGDAQTTEFKRFSLGVQPIIYTQPDTDFMLMLRGAYGIQPELSFHGKAGVFGDEIYVGGHIKYRLLSELQYPITLSLVGGAYMFNDIGLKLGGILSRNFGQFSLYSGLSFEPYFAVPAQGPLLIPIGVDIPVTPQTTFIFEADLAVNEVGRPYQALHFGLNFGL